MNYERKVQIGDATLYLGDSLEILPELETVECVATDPPYLLEAGGNNPKDAHKRMAGCFAVDRYDNSGGIVECNIDWQDFMPLIADRVERGHIYVMCNNRHICNMLNAADEAGMRFHNMLVWDKVTSTPNRWYMKNCEFIGMFYKGKAQYINNMSNNQLMKCPHRDVTEHPTEKPVSLMQYYIENSTLPDQTVLDPFMGVGSTGVAAIQSGRKFLGIEIDERWFDEACERIEIANNQRGLFL